MCCHTIAHLPISPTATSSNRRVCSIRQRESSFSLFSLFTRRVRRRLAHATSVEGRRWPIPAAVTMGGRRAPPSNQRRPFGTSRPIHPLKGKREGGKGEFSRAAQSRMEAPHFPRPAKNDVLSFLAAPRRCPHPFHVPSTHSSHPSIHPLLRLPSHRPQPTALLKICKRDSPQQRKSLIDRCSAM